ncbi:CRISPR-associated helicase Cas3' [Chamaesiphon sp. VAR_48_metabat_135_sub]|uniref:CRISPR-associated helicase Cas3' n=1 Tax=Chamaesiphon sp. VAR_48_metabat_135_sub TaxID=2964699 RepID=UPI00286AEF91|nr:CRISPR-associated helicase Cas3' [Chamaesiphon sp. VAR_48_metabat_135_sub]
MQYKFNAHTPPKGEDKWHELKEHLGDVANLAEEFADKFKAGKLGYYAGLWHDLGKYNPEFQKYLDKCHSGTSSYIKKVPHAIHGAKLAWDLYKPTPLALLIYGHHAGLPAKSELPDKLANPKHEEDYKIACANAEQELGKLQIDEDFNPLVRSLLTDCYSYDLLTRLLFSCLVDADYLDTEEHFKPAQTIQRQQSLAEPLCKRIDLTDLWTKLKIDREKVIQAADISSVNQVRREVYEACTDAAELPAGVFRLAVPTGGGKTLSGLSFALKHALKYGLDRVIIAVPYTSIIEQTVNVYRDILGENAVLEHHSAANTEQFYSDDKEEINDDARQQYAKARLATQNWDVPLIVTTTVQLFESLFANRPSKCRKLHNIVKSVIILDEVQTLPVGLLSPILSVLGELCDRYQVTVVLCTATQPAFTGDTGYLKGLKNVRDIIAPDLAIQHFQNLQRVNYELHLQGWLWSDLIDDLVAHQQHQALIVLNTRKDTLAVLDVLNNRSDDFDRADIFHLSTLLCGKHRREVLATVKARLKNNLPCILVSTQVVEAGVDLDFPAVYRAVGPLDRIVQAAGRCNREGKLGLGRVVIFQPSEGKVPQGEYQTAVDETIRLLNRENLNLHDPSIFEEYFQCLYQSGADIHQIQDLRKRLDFPEVAKKFRLISDDTTSVIIEYDDKVRKRLRELNYRDINAGDYRFLQPYMVSLRNYEFLQGKDLCAEIAPGLYVWGGTYHAVKGIGIGARSIDYDPADLML